MKHYLDLVKISARQHRKQNRMTRLCIVLAVFLVTVIYGMADMEMRSQMIQAVKTDGSWHAAFLVDEKKGALLAVRPEAETVARYGVLNYNLKDGYQIKGTETAICGFDREFLEMVPDAEITEGKFPETKEEAVLNESAKIRLGVKVGDTIRLQVPRGDVTQYRITGITKDTSLEAEHDAFGMFLNTEGFSSLRPEETEAAQEVLYYVKFRKYCNIQKAIQEISRQFDLKPRQVRQNAKVLMLMFQSGDSYMMRLYLVAAILAGLVMIAGIFMITASMNSNIAGRTEFFGMLRCLGATKKQVIRFVRREALGWCRRAIPAGILAGILVVWLLCGMLRYLSPGLFEGLPVLGISWLAIAAGVVVGLITVLLAARAPARRASKVSPLTAVSGNAGTVQAVKRTANTKFFKVDTALGIHHAWGSKKNFFLITGSFAFSIILFLAFSTAIDFMNHAITPLRPSAPDLSIYKEDASNEIPQELADKIKKYPGVRRAFGRSYAELPLKEDGRTLILLSYDEQQLRWAEPSLVEGGLSEALDGKGALSVFREGSALATGDSVRILADGREQEITITGILEDVPYHSGMDSNTGSRKSMLICSEELFRELTGEKDYSVLDVQLHSETSDLEVREIRREMEQSCKTDTAFSDKRIRNQEVKGASYSMSVFLYGFLAVIAMIGFFNIMNSIAMSVSARMKEYVSMHAIGMSVRQLVRMITGEAVTYIVSGVIFGCTAGLPLNRVLFRSLVTSRWGDAWEIPGWELLVIVMIMLVSVCMAVMGPVRQMKRIHEIRLERV